MWEPNFFATVYKKRYCFDKKWHVRQVSDNRRRRGHNKRELVSTVETQCTQNIWFLYKIKISSFGHIVFFIAFSLLSQFSNKSTTTLFGQPAIKGTNVCFTNHKTDRKLQVLVFIFHTNCIITLVFAECISVKNVMISLIVTSMTF